MTIEEAKTKLKEYTLVSVNRTVNVVPNVSRLVSSIKPAPTLCLGNAYKAGEKTKAKIIEGLVLVCVDSRPHGVFGHCWNKIDGKHFDLTLDFAQPVAVSVIPGEKVYKHFEKTESTFRKYYKKAADKELSWFTDSIEFGQFLKDLGPEKLLELFHC